MRWSSLALAVTLAAISLSSPALAQGVPAGRAVAVSGAPVLARQAVGVRRASDAPLPRKNPAPFRTDTRQNRTLMIVGGAGMLTGLVIGHDAGVLISVGGAVVFLWGLYQYLQ
jgi:hypothetical protein